MWNARAGNGDAVRSSNRSTSAGVRPGSRASSNATTPDVTAVADDVPLPRSILPGTRIAGTYVGAYTSTCGPTFDPSHTPTEPSGATIAAPTPITPSYAAG